ncbi:MAG: PTS transporter subunit EIIB [Tildeniella nuda ZEHNDER 1965/U140]|jgi:PTS system glucose-specific IIC component|nr:PTS transporter subunit EIIB [Tildeniella nuda ZEHNDER 1965/U140]
MTKVNKAKLKALGASGVLEIGDSAQAIFGTRSENLKTDMIEYLKTAGADADPVDDLPDEPVVTEMKPLEEQPAMIPPDPNAANKAQAIVNGLGGQTNIRQVESVALTRLCVEVIDRAAVNEQALQAAGVEGILSLPEGKMHLLVGLNAAQYAAAMDSVQDLTIGT